MSKVLVSGCLLGERVRHDASIKSYDHEFLKDLVTENLIIGVCPEILGGLPVPRPAAEIRFQTVININQIDVTTEFAKGAHRTLEIAQRHQIRMAILKSNSPSCSNQQVYDGNFEGILIDGMGITANLLERNRIKVFNELQLDEAQNYYQRILNTP